MSFLSIIHYIRHTTSCFMNLVSGKLFNASHGGSQNQAYSANSGMAEFIIAQGLPNIRDI